MWLFITNNSITVTVVYDQKGELTRYLMHYTMTVVRYCSHAKCFLDSLIKFPDKGPYSRISYDLSWASDWSRWPSRPIRSLRYIVTREYGPMSSISCGAPFSFHPSHDTVLKGPVPVPGILLSLHWFHPRLPATHASAAAAVHGAGDDARGWLYGPASCADDSQVSAAASAVLFTFFLHINVAFASPAHHGLSCLCVFFVFSLF